MTQVEEDEVFQPLKVDGKVTSCSGVILRRMRVSVSGTGFVGRLLWHVSTFLHLELEEMKLPTCA